MSSPAVANDVHTAANSRRFIEGDEAVVLADIYQQDCNMVVWRRNLDSELTGEVEGFLRSDRSFQASMKVSPEDAFAAVHKELGGSEATQHLSQDIAEMVDMFCCLFDLHQAGLRLTALNGAMCPKFHVDHVPCRLISTYQGVATEWLPHAAVDRSKLGRGSMGKTDAESGLYLDQSDIQQLYAGDVGLLKGERWVGNEGAGLVHRSPMLAEGEKRLLLTLDFA